VISFPVGEDINQGSNSGGSKTHTHPSLASWKIVQGAGMCHLVAVLSNPVGHGLPRLRCGPIGEAKVRGFSGPA